MNIKTEESIFDENDLNPQKAKPIYKYVAILRIILLLMLLTASIAIIISTGMILYYAAVANNWTSVSLSSILLKCAPIVLYYFMIHYNVSQAYAEFKLSTKVYSKRVFRLFTICINIVFIVAILISTISSNLLDRMNPIIGLLMFFFIVVISFLIYFDIQLYRMKNRTTHF